MLILVTYNLRLCVFTNIFFFLLSLNSRSIALIPEEAEDIWHAYNLISEGDTVRSTTIRKVQQQSDTGSSSSSRVRTTLSINVEAIDFDTQACVLRLKGRNVEENPYVKVSVPLPTHLLSIIKLKC